MHVLQDISLDVRDDEFLVILGLGQYGKSTLLPIIEGLETPSEGTVLLDDQPITKPGTGPKVCVPELHAVCLADGDGQS